MKKRETGEIVSPDTIAAMKEADFLTQKTNIVRGIACASFEATMSAENKIVETNPESRLVYENLRDETIYFADTFMKLEEESILANKRANDLLGSDYIVPSSVIVAFIGEVLPGMTHSVDLALTTFFEQMISLSKEDFNVFHKSFQDHLVDKQNGDILEIKKSPKFFFTIVFNGSIPTIKFSGGNSRQTILDMFLPLGTNADDDNFIESIVINMISGGKILRRSKRRKLVSSTPSIIVDLLIFVVYILLGGQFQ
jgi:hypothetical protein